MYPRKKVGEFNRKASIMAQTRAPELFIEKTIAPLARRVLASCGSVSVAKDGSVSIGAMIDAGFGEKLWIDYDKYPGRGSRTDMAYVPGTETSDARVAPLSNLLGVRTVAIERIDGDHEELMSLDEPTWSAVHARRIVQLMDERLSQNGDPAH